MVEMVGTADECVDFYMETSIDKMFGHTEVTERNRKHHRDLELEYLDIKMLNDPLNMSNEEPLELECIIRRNQSEIKETQFGIFINNSSDVTVYSCYSNPIKLPDTNKPFKVRITLPHLQLARGTYKVDMNMSKFDFMANARDYDLAFGVLAFEVKYQDSAHTRPFIAWARNLGSIASTDAVVKIENN